MSPVSPVVLPGLSAPLGASVRSLEGLAGVNFALYASRATAVSLCLMDGPGGHETARLPLRRGPDGVWQGFVPGLASGQHYGYRVDGPWSPARGLTHNSAKLLLDPYARRVDGTLDSYEGLHGFRPGSSGKVADPVDTAARVPLARVVDDSYDWGADRLLHRPWAETIIYELHVKGFTRLHPAVPEDLRGTYAGLAQPAVVNYLRGLGITAVELMPIATHVSEPELLDRGLSNYWGYNTLAFFAPHAGYAKSDPVTEFRDMVKTLHAAGIEVILDVVFNHTAEGGAGGPMLSFKGIDNPTYYRLAAGDRSAYINDSGCGNSLDVSQPVTLRLVMDCLRYWVTQMHVDGFRFDLGPSMARENGRFDPGAAFFDCIYQDPQLAGVKLIAEPWDVGPDGYRLGQFPPGWSEWNDRYRDVVRGYWRGDPGKVGDLAERLAGSSDLFNHHGRNPSASVNFIASHDGFTLRDTVSYAAKHNEANGESNRDGHNHNLSANYGVEGPTADARINAVRLRQSKNLLATLMLSQGVPMLLAGDERGRSQQGNNNAYAQDNAMGWVDWTPSATAHELTAFVRRIIGLRREHPVFRRTRFLMGRFHQEVPVPDVTWIAPDGSPMEMSDWQSAAQACLGIVLAGRIRDPDTGRLFGIDDDSFLVWLNAAAQPVRCVLPASPGGDGWAPVLDTGREGESAGGAIYLPAQHYRLESRSLALFAGAVRRRPVAAGSGPVDDA